jgi:tetratricopeptide (TPR) repeat protein
LVIWDSPREPGVSFGDGGLGFKLSLANAASWQQTCREMPKRPATHVDDPVKVGERLKAARLAAGLSQRQLAFTGCGPAYISRIEAGMRVPSLQVIHEFARRIGVTPEYISHGLAAEEDPETPLLQAEVALRLGAGDEAEPVFTELAGKPGPYQSRAEAGLGQLAFRAGRFAEAIRHLEHAVALDDRRLLRDPGAAETLARAYAATGALEQSVAILEDGVEQARDASATVEVLRFGVLLANALIDLGQFDRARVPLVEVIRIAADSRDPLTHARVYWAQSRFHILNGEPQLAARYARRALNIFEQTENDSFSALAYHLLAYAEVEAGDPTAALEHLERGRELFAGTITPLEDAKFAIEEARALLALRRTKSAARSASRALARMEALDPGDRGRSYVVLAGVFRANGEPERALELYELALELLSEHGRPYVVQAAGRLAQLLEELGRPLDALEVLKRGLRVQEELGVAAHAN